MPAMPRPRACLLACLLVLNLESRVKRRSPYAVTECVAAVVRGTYNTDGMQVFDTPDTLLKVLADRQTRLGGSND